MLYKTFFVKENGDRMPSDMFHEICKLSGGDPELVVLWASFVGYEFVPVMGIPLQTWINLAFPGGVPEEYNAD